MSDSGKFEFTDLKMLIAEFSRVRDMLMAICPILEDKDDGRYVRRAEPDSGLSQGVVKEDAN